MGSPVRYPFGVNNIDPSTVLRNLPIPDWSKLHVFLDDFDKYTAAQWTVGGVNAGVPALTAGDGGLLVMTNAGANGDSTFIQQAQPAFVFTPGKQLFFRARAALNAITFGSVALGLQVAVAANNFLTPANGVFLRKSASNAGMELVNRVGGAETATATFGDYTGGQVDVAFYYDGKGTIWAGLGNDLASISLTPAAISSAAMGVVAGVQNTSAASRVLTLDQLYCVKER